MANELSDIVAKNTSDIQELQVGDAPTDFNTKFVFLNESLSGTDALVAKKRVVGTEFNLDRSKLATAYPAPWPSDSNTMMLLHLDETSPTAVISDSSGNGNNSSTISGTTVSDGIFFKARTFNGTTNCFTVNNSATNNLGGAGSSYTVDFWFKTVTGADSRLALKRVTSTGQHPAFFNLLPAGSMYFSVYNGVSSVDVWHPAIVNNGVWHHVAGVRDQTTGSIYIYVDNVLGQSKPDTFGNVQNTDPWQIGAGQNFGYFNGQIEEFRLSNIARHSFAGVVGSSIQTDKLMGDGYQASGAIGWTWVVL